MSEYPPRSEYPQRLERLRALMVERGMQAVLLGTGANLAYFSGYPSPARSVPRPFFVLLPLNGDPVFLTHLGHAAEVRKFSWISDVRSYAPLARVPVESIKAALAEKADSDSNKSIRDSFVSCCNKNHLSGCIRWPIVTHIISELIRHRIHLVAG